MYDDEYVEAYHLKGDFSSVLNKMEELPDSYNLYFNNCGQVSLRLLATADTAHSQMLYEASRLLLPSDMNEYVAEYVEETNPNNRFSSLKDFLDAIRGLKQ